MNTESIVNSLLESNEPAIRFKVRTGYLGENPNARALRTLRNEVRDSRLVACLMKPRRKDGTFPDRVYSKWQGAHWVMATLADIGYPTADKTLLPIRDQLQAHWLSERFFEEFQAPTKAKAYAGRGVPVMDGRHRRCASQQSNALWSILKLGLENRQTHDFVERLLHWQWPDGGWNCDKEPQAHHSSFMESILPVRALAHYGKVHDHRPALDAAQRGAEIFLKRRLFLRQSDGKLMKREFVQLHYPLYWHYDILHGLKVMAEAGFIGDGRCKPALQRLMDKQLPDGGWPAEHKYYRASSKQALGNDAVDWGGTSRKTMNPWVTADALYVLRAAGYVD